MQEAFTFAMFAGLVLPILAAFLTQSNWSSTAKRWLIIVLAVVATGAGVLFEYWPGGWLIVGPLIATTIGIAQMVYTILKPTGALDWLEAKTELPKRAMTEDEDPEA